MSEQGGHSDESPDGFPDEIPIREISNEIPDETAGEIPLCEVSNGTTTRLDNTKHPTFRMYDQEGALDEQADFNEGFPDLPSNITELEIDYRRAENECQDAVRELWRAMTKAASQGAREVYRPGVRNFILHMQQQTSISTRYGTHTSLEVPYGICLVLEL